MNSFFPVCCDYQVIVPRNLNHHRLTGCNEKWENIGRGSPNKTVAYRNEQRLQTKNEHVRSDCRGRDRKVVGWGGEGGRRENKNSRREEKRMMMMMMMRLRIG